MNRIPPSSTVTCGKPGTVVLERRPPTRSLISKSATLARGRACFRRHAAYVPATPAPMTAMSTLPRAMLVTAASPRLHGESIVAVAISSAQVALFPSRSRDQHGSRDTEAKIPDCQEGKTREPSGEWKAAPSGAQSVGSASVPSTIAALNVALPPRSERGIATVNEDVSKLTGTSSPPGAIWACPCETLNRSRVLSAPSLGGCGQKESVAPGVPVFGLASVSKSMKPATAWSLPESAGAMAPAKLTVRQEVVASAVAETEVMSWRTAPLPKASPTVSVTEKCTVGLAGQVTVGVAGAAVPGSAACRCQTPFGVGADGAIDREDAGDRPVEATAGQ